MNTNNKTLDEFEQVYSALASFMNDFAFLKNGSHLSQKEIAKKTGTTQSAISRIETMKTNPSYKQLVKLSQAVGGKLFVTPMGKMTVTVPYDLQEGVATLAKENKTTVHHLLCQIIRNAVEDELGSDFTQEGKIASDDSFSWSTVAKKGKQFEDSSHSATKQNMRDVEHAEELAA